MSEPKTIAGCRVFEYPLPEGVQFALVGQRQAAILLTDGSIKLTERNQAGDWTPTHDPE